MMKKANVKIGLLGIGLETYWEQFEGLLSNLNKYQEFIRGKIENFGVEIIDVGMVDNPEKAKNVANVFKSLDVELIFLYISTYALSSTVLLIAQKVKVPIILLNLQPVPQLNYDMFNSMNDRGSMTGLWLEHCQACSVPEVASVFNRTGIKYDIVTGYLDDKQAWNDIQSWTEAACVANSLRRNRMGVLGHYYGGMLDVYTDLTRQSANFGTHFEMLEMCELRKIREEVSKLDIKNKLKEFHEVFDVSQECDFIELDRAARTSIALDRLVSIHQLDSIAYYYEGQPNNEYEDIVTSIIAGTTLLTGKNIPVAGECEIKNAHAMKIMAEFGAGGSFSEFYLIDFKDEVIFLGHDGPAHFAIAEGRVRLVPLPVYHGKPGKGLSIQMAVKQGPVTLLSVVEGIHGVFLLVAEGESISGQTLQIGNTNSRYSFPLGVKNFIERWSKLGPAHHCAIGIGHISNKIEKLAKILNIDCVVI